MCAALSVPNVSQIGGQIYQSTAIRGLTGALAAKGFSQTEIQGAVAGAQSALFESLDGELRNRAIVAVTNAMQMKFVMVPIAGAAMIIAAVVMKNERLFGGPAVAVGG
ncbi:unnamed protein product [Penicillium pancosmium]